MRHLAVCLTLAALLATAAADEPPADLSRLGWMAGWWVHEDGGSRLDEIWMEPAGGSMLGVNRTVEAGRTTGFELLRLTVADGAVVYLASPGGRCPPTPFELVELDDRRAVFANPEHDFPQRITYWREGDTLLARIDGSVDGKPRSASWSWTLRPVAATPPRTEQSPGD